MPYQINIHNIAIRLCDVVGNLAGIIQDLNPKGDDGKPDLPEAGVLNFDLFKVLTIEETRQLANLESSRHNLMECWKELEEKKRAILHEARGRGEGK